MDYGTLVDTDIKLYAKRGQLIKENFEEQNVKQACYELRVGNYYYDLNDYNKRYEINEEDYIVLRPHQRCVIITLEKLFLPEDILGKIFAKGSLFSLGIAPVSTYADPGFYGRLGIVLHNTSNNFLKFYI